MPCFVVLENAEPGAAAAAAAEIAADAVVVHGWSSTPAHGPRVCVGSVASEQDAAQAVLAALAGASLVVDARGSRDVIDQLCDDLRRIGSVDHRLGPADLPTLSVDERALLAQLLGGATLGEAAANLHLSRRTADRRLAGARAALGVASTPQALRRAAEIGVKPAR